MKFPRIDATWVLVLLAFVLRAGWVLYGWQQSGPALRFPDEELHWQLATNLVERGTLVTDDGRFAPRMPLYPLFLALFAGAGSYGVLLARLAQATLGAAGVLVATRFAVAVLGRRAGLLAGVLICFDPFAVFFANLLLNEVLFTLVILILTVAAWSLAQPLWCRHPAGTGAGWKPAPQLWCGHLACTSARETPGYGIGRSAIIAFAVAAAAAVLTRPEALGFVVLLSLLLLAACARRAPAADSTTSADQSAAGAPRGRVLLALLGAAATLTLTLLPWGLRNSAAIGDYAWLSANGGVTLFDAQGPQADGSSNQEFLSGFGTRFDQLGEAGRDAELRRRAFQQMALDPARVVQLAGVKLLRTWSPLPNNPEFRGGGALAGAVYTVLLLGGAFFVLARWCASCARPAAAEGSGDERRSVCGRYFVLVWLPVVYFTLITCLFIGSVRYRVPLMPFLALAAVWDRFPTCHGQNESGTEM